VSLPLFGERDRKTNDVSARDVQLPKTQFFESASFR